MDADGDALLATIAAHPADDVARLVYADWLDEHDLPIRAEFIRLQVEIAKLELLPRHAQNAHIPKWVRQQEILDNYLSELMGPAAGVTLIGPPVFDRGFMTEVRLHLDDFLGHAHWLAELRPVPAVKGVGFYEDYQYWSTSAHLPLITTLDLNNFRSDGVMPVDPVAVDGSAGWRKLAGVRSVLLTRNEIADPGLRAIPWADLPALVDLDLSNNNLTDDGVIHLIGTGLPQRLTRLVLGGNPLTDQAAYELADRVGRNAGLKHLNLRHTDITSVGQAALLAKFGGRVDLF